MKKQLTNSLILTLTGITLWTGAFTSSVKAETITNKNLIQNKTKTIEFAQNNNLKVEENKKELDLIDTVAPFIFIGFLGAFALVLATQKTSDTLNSKN
ncbi:MAG: hypothetical protein QNJ54_06910 [Prochloraceae cyanobacterium]|nr:hypothetical protein [Prochloraceae cyanobacterium]